MRDARLARSMAHLEEEGPRPRDDHIIRLVVLKRRRLDDTQRHLPVPSRHVLLRLRDQRGST
jgi:hypothetical protein